MKIQLPYFFTLSFFLFWINFSNAQVFIGEIDFQDTNQTHVLIFKNQDQKVGRISSIKNTIVTFLEKEKLSPVTYPLFDIEKIIASDAAIDVTTPEGQIEATEAEKNKINYLSESPRAQGDHRLFYAETGFNLPRGVSEYRTIWGIVHSVDYGISDGLTMGLGYIYPGAFTTHLKFNYIGNYIHSKLRGGFDFKTALKPEKIFNNIENKNEIQWEGYIQMATYFSYGTPDRNAHLALNLIPLFSADGFGDGILISFSFGGTIQLTNHLKLVYENNFGVLEDNRISNFGFFSGLGLNWFNEKNSIKFGIHSSPNFGFFNMPFNDLNTTARLPFFSYSRFF